MAEVPAGGAEGPLAVLLDNEATAALSREQLRQLIADGQLASFGPEHVSGWMERSVCKQTQGIGSPSLPLTRLGGWCCRTAGGQNWMW